jgi:hypothetical protein
MPSDIPDQDIRRSLARAFDRAWGSYYRSGNLTISQDIARTELARHLVHLSKTGVLDETMLASAGLSHLHQLSGKHGKTVTAASREESRPSVKSERNAAHAKAAREVLANQRLRIAE